MSEIANNIVLQYGAVGLLIALLGYLYTTEKKERIALLDDYKDVFQKSLKLNLELKELLLDLQDSVSVKDLIIQKYLKEG